ncbi:helix-turn-helix domain-containing protein [Pedobacter sp. HDW13]|uniref:helix-turn-helix domain-containing protein n=1 Tax=Pedobacter sp. HDW13 TaxID=2714940 RepID=UPI0014082F23|nr:helix-turn-helix domain-containing protein [Pedobacter sp. HDW13]QIL41197.1 helix-turn-helix domain-containing protein [Pedobacter sp. HDW13]
MEDKNSQLIPIEKNLEAEANMAEHIACFRMAGSSQINNFRSPDAYVFIFFKDGEGWHSIDFVKYQECNLQIHISYPGQIHSWNSASCTNGYKLIVSRYFVEKYMYEIGFINSKINKYPVVDIIQDSYKRLIADLTSIEEDLSKPEVQWDLLILRTRLIITTIDHLMKEALRGKKNNMYNPILHRYGRLIDEYFACEKSVAFYANKLAITPNYLNMICRQFNGLNSKALIDQRMLLEAKRLLLGTSLSIKEIGYKLGFGDIAHFSSFMRLKTGFNPKRFRETAIEGDSSLG